MTEFTVIYDGDCEICNALRRWAEAHDKAGTLRFVPNQTADLAQIAPGLTREQAQQSVYAVNAAGQRFRGARAIFETVRRLPGCWGILGTIGALPPVSWLAEPMYRIVAHHRAAVSRRLGLNQCLLDREE